LLLLEALPIGLPTDTGFKKDPPVLISNESGGLENG
jgi:hypothetical protein